ncbi:hypothetical protein PV328_012059, partial [Microctonus aethiopoides]
MEGSGINEYYRFRKFIEKLLIIAGMFPLERPNFFYHFIPYFNILGELWLGLGVIGFLRLHIKNVLVVANLSGLLLSNTISIIKICCFLTYRKNIIHLLKSGDNYYASRMKIPHFTNLFKDFSLYWRCLCILAITSFLAYFCRVLIPVYGFINDKIHHVENIQYRLPAPVVYPWKIPDVFRMISELREIIHAITHLHESKNPEKIIRDCTTQYVSVLETRNIIQDIFGPIILQMLIINAIVLCTGVFVISQMKFDPVILGFFVGYIFARISQTCVVAFAGSQLITESEYYKDAVYSVDWHENDKLKTFVVLTLIQNPINLVACHFSIISLNVLVS